MGNKQLAEERETERRVRELERLLQDWVSVGNDTFGPRHRACTCLECTALRMEVARLDYDAIH